MTRPHALVMRLALSAVVSLGAHAASGLDRDDVSCVCLDGATGSDDVASCVALLGARLVGNGAMTDAELVAMTDDARAGRLQPPVGCGQAGAAELQPLTYGAAVRVDRPFYSPGDVVGVALEIWNNQAEPVTFRIDSPDGAGCAWDFRILNAGDRLVRVETRPCGSAPSEIVIAPGSGFSASQALPLLALGSEAGHPDGMPLPPGHYRVLAALVNDAAPRLGFTGGIVAIRIE